MLLFEKLYRELLDLYSENINSVPRNVLGMSTSVQDLPEHAPYGFWVDRSGNFMSLPYQGHEKGIKQVVDRTREFLKTQGVAYTPKYRYSDLLDPGWARVVTSGPYVEYELGVGNILTPSQKRFLEFINDLYDKQGVLEA